MMRNGVCAALPSSERHTSENASSSWPTYLSSEAEHGGPNQRDSSGRPTLTAAERRRWSTPQAQDSKSGREQRGYTQNLTHQVQRWPTPTAIDSGSGRVNQSLGPDAPPRPTLAKMANAGMWPTPAARDWKSGTGAQKSKHNHGQPLTNVEGIRGRLNPEWVEALMGFPENWTKLS
jgi:hypothetical protein